MEVPRLLTQPPPPDAGKSSALLFARRTVFALAAVALVFLLKDVWILALLALVFAIVFDFPVRFLSRHMPRGAATLLTLALGLGSIFFLAPVFINPFVEQARQAEQRIPEAIEKAKQWLRYNQSTADSGAANVLPSGADLARGVEKKTQNIAASIVESAGKALAQATEFGTTLILLLALSLFFVHEPLDYRAYARALVPKEYEPAFEILWNRLGDGLRKWVGGILISMTIMGVFTAIGLKIAGVQNWLLLGVLTFFGTFVPYVGAIASAIPGLLVALAQSPRTFLFALIVYVAVHVVEGYVAQPLVMKRAVTIHPAVLLLWQLTMGTAFGVPGLIVATPLYVCLKVTLDFLYVERGLGKEPYPPPAPPSSHDGQVFEEKSA